MRYLLLSDVHGNRHALEAVLAAAPPASFDRVLVLGDLVGYGADPNAVVDRVRALDPFIVIRGNHDKVACGLEPPDEFNQIARQAVLWTLKTLTDENREYLRALPAGPCAVGERAQVCHGSPVHEDEYIFDGADAAAAFGHLERPVCFFGHTHIPVVFVRSRQRLEAQVPSGEETTVLHLEPETLYLVNPGSVGQPRDGDARAAFAVFDDGTGEVALRRVPYPVEQAQEAIRTAGLPAVLANRLAAGR